ncbi:MAG: DnaA regulatory inactivator Hda [Pseudomonadota bacterium]
MVTTQLSLDVTLDVEARFETYHAGPNTEAVAALQRLPAPGVWLAGEPNSGRSHLLQAVIAAAPAGQAIFLPMTQSLPADCVDGLPGHLTVCLDDVGAVAGNDEWERALLLLYENALKFGGRLVVSATGNVAESGFELPDLESRLTSLARFRLRVPSDEDQYAALLKRADARGLRLSEGAAAYMLKHLPRALSTLFEWLRVLDHHSLSSGRKLTLPFVRGLVRESGADLQRAAELTGFDH